MTRTRIDMITAIKLVVDLKKEEWNGFAVVEPDDGFWSDFTDDQWNTYVTIPTGSTVTADDVRANLDTHIANLNLMMVRTTRRSEYPTIEDQLDLIYHSGIDAWKSKIKETKDKYPKPS